MFADARKRRLHLIDKHHYPRYFPFDLVYTGTLTFEQRKIRDEKNKARIHRYNMEKGDVDMIEEGKDSEEAHKDKGKRKTDTDKGDTDMDELVTGMSKLKIPKTISFGHISASLPHHRKPRYHKPSEEKQVDVEMKEKKVYSHPRKRGPKKKKQIQMMEE